MKFKNWKNKKIKLIHNRYGQLTFKMVHNVQERIFLVQSAFVSGLEYSSKVQEEFKRPFGNERSPYRICVFELIEE